MSSNILRAFSSLARLKLMTCLKKGSKNVSQLIETCNLSQSAVSQHLAKLKIWGLVTCQKKGKQIFYQLKKKKAADISQQLLVFYKNL